MRTVRIELGTAILTVVFAYLLGIATGLWFLFELSAIRLERSIESLDRTATGSSR